MNRFTPQILSPSAARLAIALPAFFALTLALIGSTPASAGDRPTKLERQIEVMERAIDEMLVDSPNFLVSGKNVTEGFEDEGSGVLFLFSASLTDWWWDEDGRHRSWSFWPFEKQKRITIRRSDDGNKSIYLDDHGEIIIKDGEVSIRSKDGEVLELEASPGSDKSDQKDKVDRGTRRDRQWKKYERARDELVMVLMDYGEVLSALPAGQQVKIMAKFSDLDLPKDKKIRKLTVKASIDDLRLYADGKIDEAQMRSRIEIKES